MYRQFNIQQLYVLPHTVYLCVLCGFENKQPLFPYTALTDWFLYQRRSVFTARYGLKISIRFKFSPFATNRGSPSLCPKAVLVSFVVCKVALLQAVLPVFTSPHCHYNSTDDPRLYLSTHFSY